jgi:hypothetical protein
MLKRLFRSKHTEYMPGYSALKANPSRGLPPDLTEMEGSESFSARREALESALLDTSQRPEIDAPLFIELVDSGSGFVSLTLPNGSRCVPIFSTPFRAADYMYTLLRRGPRMQYLCTSPIQLIPMLRDLEDSGVERVALDRCPRCGILCIIESHSIKDPNDAVNIWAIFKATELARTELYFTYALASARTGRLELARDVGLEAVGHVTMEDPRLHLLLGQVGIGLGDGVLLKEAKASLDYFKKEAWRRCLDQNEESGMTDYAGPEGI